VEAGSGFWAALMDFWFRCELRSGEQSQFKWVRYPSALVGNVFNIDRERWEIVAVEFPGLPAALIERREPVLTKRR
jgi:hypothetical protein